MKVAIYARYSSENQSEKSINDQIRVWSEPSGLNMPPAYLDSSNSCRLKLIVYGGGGIRSFVSPSVRCRAADSFGCRLQSVHSNPFVPTCHRHLETISISDSFNFIVFGGGGGIRTLEAGNPPPNRLAGGPIQPLLHSSKRVINEYQRDTYI